MTIAVPAFGVGEIDAVMQYAKQAVPRFCDRIGCDNPSEVEEAFMVALAANAARMEETLMAAYVPYIEESRHLLSLMEQELVGAVELSGFQHMEAALEFMANGGNVLLVSNHTSGADTLVLDYIVNRLANNAAYDWTYMAGHVVNLYLLPLVVAGGVNRLQIFSERYAQLVDGEMRKQMRAQNAAALRRLHTMAGEGGHCIVLYPEGGRGEGTLKPGEPQTMQIAQLIGRTSPHGLRMLPSYVVSTDILPVRRGPNEFNEFVEYTRPGNATLRFGQGVRWEDLLPTTRLAPAETRQHLLGGVMRHIADLAPTVAARGPHV